MERNLQSAAADSDNLSFMPSSECAPPRYDPYGPLHERRAPMHPASTMHQILKQILFTCNFQFIHFNCMTHTCMY
jgi:hypothetical protein